MDKDEERLNKLRQAAKKIGKGLKEFVPEISGAAIGAAFGNPVIGAIIGTAAKKLLDTFIKAKSNKSDLNDAMKKNIERFSDATIMTYGTIQRKEKEMYQYKAKVKAKDIEQDYTVCSTLSPQEIAAINFKTTFTSTR